MNKGKKYHYDNVYTLPRPLRFIDLVQVGEIITQVDHVIELHDQVCSEISYVISGQCDFYIDDKVLHAKKGDIHVIGPGKTHKIVAGTEDNFRMAYIAFHFHENEDMKNMEKFFKEGALFLQNDKLQLKTTFERILSELYITGSYSNEMVDVYATQILIQVYRLFNPEDRVDGRLYKGDLKSNYIMGYAVFQTLRYVDNNIEKIENVQQVASQLKYNSAYLSRIFHERMGVTLSDYIRSKKVEDAKGMLKSGMSVNEVAQRMGYSTTQSFSKMFQRYEKCLPSTYKEEKTERK